MKKPSSIFYDSLKAKFGCCLLMLFKRDLDDYCLGML